jgi:uncharacterized MAPEG superfamily protein
MTTAYWCVLAAALLPYIWTIAAKAGPGFDNTAPRIYLDRLTGWRQRATWAQLNAFEALPPFIAAVLIAHQLHAPQERVDLLALVFVGLRLAHGLAYIANLATLRSLLWTGGIGCVIGLFVIAS